MTRRVVAKDIDAASVSVAEVMTRDPNSVTMTDPAVNALMLMVDNHYRHLPVLDDEGSVVGLLDIAKCLNDAISKLEQSNEKNASAAENAVKQAVGQHDTAEQGPPGMSAPHCDNTQSSRSFPVGGTLA